MTSADFKVNSDLVASWKELKETEIFKLVMEVLSAESPLTEKAGAIETEALVHYGKILGYDLVRQKMDDLAVYTEQKPHPKRTYARRDN